MQKPHLQIALAIIWQGGEILIARRRDDADHMPGVWEFPGGKCRPAETPAAAAMREAREELGVEIRITATRPVLEFDYETRRVTLHPFDVEIISGEPQPLECSALRWVKPAELYDGDFPAANAPLLENLRMKNCGLNHSCPK